MLYVQISQTLKTVIQGSLWQNIQKLVLAKENNNFLETNSPPPSQKRQLKGHGGRNNTQTHIYVNCELNMKTKFFFFMYRLSPFTQLTCNSSYIFKQISQLFLTRRNNHMDQQEH